MNLSFLKMKILRVSNNRNHTGIFKVNLEMKVWPGLPARSMKDFEKKTHILVRILVKCFQHVRNCFKHSSVFYTA